MCSDCLTAFSIGKAMESESGSDHEDNGRSSSQAKEEEDHEKRVQLELIKTVAGLVRKAGCSIEDLRLIRMDMKEEEEEETLGHASEVLQGFLWLGK